MSTSNAQLQPTTTNSGALQPHPHRHNTSIFKPTNPSAAATQPAAPAQANPVPAPSLGGIGMGMDPSQFDNGDTVTSFTFAATATQSVSVPPAAAPPGTVAAGRHVNGLLLGHLAEYKGLWSAVFVLEDREAILNMAIGSTAVVRKLQASLARADFNGWCALEVVWNNPSTFRAGGTICRADPITSSVTFSPPFERQDIVCENVTQAMEKLPRLAAQRPNKRASVVVFDHSALFHIEEAAPIEDPAKLKAKMIVDGHSLTWFAQAAAINGFNCLRTPVILLRGDALFHTVELINVGNVEQTLELVLELAPTVRSTTKSGTVGQVLNCVHLNNKKTDMKTSWMLTVQPLLRGDTLEIASEERVAPGSLIETFCKTVEGGVVVPRPLSQGNLTDLFNVNAPPMVGYVLSRRLFNEWRAMILHAVSSGGIGGAETNRRRTVSRAEQGRNATRALAERTNEIMAMLRTDGDYAQQRKRIGEANMRFLARMTGASQFFGTDDEPVPAGTWHLVMEEEEAGDRVPGSPSAMDLTALFNGSNASVAVGHLVVARGPHITWLSTYCFHQMSHPSWKCLSSTKYTDAPASLIVGLCMALRPIQLEEISEAPDLPPFDVPATA